MKRIFTALSLALLCSVAALAQDNKTDSSKAFMLDEVPVRAYRTVNGVGHLPEERSGIIYAGKKTEVILVDSIDANKAINNTRQILGRIPGLNIVETESSGFTANGIATRGLDPTQSVEMNTRQDGYNISADIFGYNESYYLPPMEAVSRIEMVRGAASLQFGPQFGGLVNYVLKDAPADKPFEFTTSQTIGSFGMFNAFNSVGGTYGKFSYYGFLQYRHIEGYRPNSEQTQRSGFGRVEYKPSATLRMGVEYTMLRNQIRMPGGLTDSLFNADPRISTRARNWLKTPWNILAGYVNYEPSGNTTISLKTSYLFSSRSLVWRDEDGGAAAADAIDPLTNAYIPREVSVRHLHNTTTELRIAHNYELGAQRSTMAAGLRYSHAWYKALSSHDGTTNSDFDLSITGAWSSDLDFTTTNIAPFIENIFRVGKKFSITPGFRFEYLYNTAKGYKTKSEIRLSPDQSKERQIPLAGIGLELKPSRSTGIYANFTQAYRPIEYSQLTPFGVTSKIDPAMKDAEGFNSDLGYRGTVGNFLNFDIGGFYLAYDNRIGTVLKTDPTTGDVYSLRTNVANSVHAGIESYLEFNVLKYMNRRSPYGLSIFNAFSYIDAKYTSGEFNGKRVEAAAETINRVGLIYSSRHFSTSLQVSSVGDAYGDASNAKVSDNPVAGYIPAYTVVDLSASYKFKVYAIRFGSNNLMDRSYFTKRADEYPGPGIIPAVGRSVYVGISATF